jgi:hypothetical protein
MDDRSAERELNKILETIQEHGSLELPMWHINILIFRFSAAVRSKIDLERWSNDNDLCCEFRWRQRQIGRRVRGHEEFAIFTPRQRVVTEL